MSDKKLYTLLGNAQAYRGEVDRARAGREPEYRDWEQSREALNPQIRTLVRDAEHLPATRRLDEVVFEMRLSPRFLAKSYHPGQLLDTAELKLRGSDSWRSGPSKDDVGRLLYLSATPAQLARTEALLTLDSPSDGLRRDFAKVETISLPDTGDRVSGVESEPDSRHAVEVVLFGWDARRRDEAVRRLEGLLRAAGAAPESILVRSYRNGPTFIAAIVQHRVLQDLRELNFLRVASPLPRMEVTRMALTASLPAPSVIPSGPLGDEWIAVVDGGVDMTIPAIAAFVRPYDCTTSAPSAKLVAHGTAVASAALYGSISPGGQLTAPPARVVSLRVLPDALADELELYGVVDSLEEWIPRLSPKARIVNLSLGPPGPITQRISRFTYALDRLAYDTGKLFITAVGNWGHKAGQDRIQSPSDAVNVLAIGAFERDPVTASRRATAYSCRGPGRAGAAVKPDLLVFGGAAASPFFVLDSAGTMVGSAGTSLAAPLAARAAADVVTRCPDLSPLAARAVMVHRATKGKDEAADGHGYFDSDTDALVSCSEREVSVVYEGVISPKNTYHLPFLLPKDYSSEGRTYFSWTIVYVPEVDGSAHDEYSVCGLEIQFRPDSNVFDWSPPKALSETQSLASKSRTLNIKSDKIEIKALEAKGWRRSLLPASTSHKRTTEHHRRLHESKWETTVCATRNRDKDITEPALTVSVVPRGPWETEDSVQASYAAILSVRAPKYDGDLYAAMVNAHQRLRAVAINAPVPIIIQT